MKKPKITIPLMLVLLLSSSCATRMGSVEARRLKAIDDIQTYHLTSKNPVMAKSSKAVLFALKSANITMLKKPTIAYAVLVEDRNESLRLHVFWIEDEPSVDGVEFKYRRETNPMILSIPMMDTRYNQSQSKRTVEFSTGFEWKTGSELATNVSQLESSELKVRLLSGKTPVTDWSSTDFYRVDKWIANNARANQSTRDQ